MRQTKGFSLLKGEKILTAYLQDEKPQTNLIWA